MIHIIIALTGFTHLAASTGVNPHCSIVHTGGAFAHIQGVVKQGLIFQAELLRPVPDRREAQSFVFSQGNALALGEILQTTEMF